MKRKLSSKLTALQKDSLNPAPNTTGASHKKADIQEKIAKLQIQIEKITKLHSRSKKIIKPSLYASIPRCRRTWDQEEDKKILELIQEHGQNWSLISKIIGGTRTGKQIRDRYLNRLNPNIVINVWTPQQDRQLLHLYNIYGRKWVQIAKLLPGRTEAMVKNRFSSRFWQYLDKDSPKPSEEQANVSNPLMEIETINPSFESGNHKDNLAGQLICKDLSLQSIREIALNKMNAMGLNKPQDINLLNINLDSLMKLKPPLTEPQIHQDENKIDDKNVNHTSGLKIENAEDQNIKCKVEFKAEEDKLTEKKEETIEQKIAQIEATLGSEQLVRDWISSVRTIVNKRKSEAKDSSALKTDCTNIAQNIFEDLINFQKSFSNVGVDMHIIVQELKKRMAN